MQTTELKPLMERLAPLKVFGAQREAAAYQVAIQDLHWSEPGGVHVRSGRHCLIELAEPPALRQAGQAHYRIQMDDERECTVGQLNFLLPETERTVRWSAGHRHAVVCLMDPQRLGLLAGIDWRWAAVAPRATVDVHNERLRHVMQWLAEEALTPSFASALQLDSLMTLLAIELHRHCAAGRPLASVTSAPAQGRLSVRQLQVINEVVAAAHQRERGGAALTLAALAQACQLPGRELSTRFRATTGQTLRSHVAASHIEQARRLLADPVLLIKQVAYRSGFRSAAAFGEAFRRATGLTPLQYRQRIGVGAVDERLTRH
jgi:AraC family transcriptional regulator